MKKLIIAALIVVAAGTSAFAADSKVSMKTQSSFNTLFVGAENVEWTTTENFSKASFTIADEKAEAFFTPEGQLIATSRKVDFKALPLKAIQQIRKEYSACQILETIEMEQDGEKNYYVSLADGNKKQILQVSLFGDVSLYRANK